MQPVALVVDDDRFMRQVLEDVLGEAGFSVLHAGDGEEGVRLAREQLPDVILMDLAMPRLDGVEACRQLRADAGFRHTPILLMTSRAELQGTVNPFQVGADDYLAKPFDAADLVARVRGSLARKRTLEALDHKVRDARTLQEIAEAVNSTLNAFAILRYLVRRIAGLLGVESCSLLYLHLEDHRGRVLAASDNPELAGLRLDLNRHPEVLEVVQSGRPARLPEGESLSFWSASSRRGLPETLLLPVIHQQRVTGAMAVLLPSGRGGLSQEEVGLCQSIANVSAFALRNAYHLKKLKEESLAARVARRRLEDDLRVKSVYAELFESASEGLAVVDPGGETLFINRRGLELLGCADRESLRGVPLTSLLDRRSRCRVRQWQRARHLGAAVSERFDVKVRTPDGATRLLSVSIGERPVAENLSVVAFRDVTGRRQMEKDLQEARATLEKANARLQRLDSARSDFLNTAVHELRMPVTIIHGYCTLLRESGTENLTGSQREYLEAAAESSDRLIDLINNLLDLSRFDAGKMALDIGCGDLCVLVREVCRDFRSLAERSGLRLVAGAPEQASCLALFDDEKVRRVLINLLGNAFKFTPAGGLVSIGLHDLGREVVVTVEDTGKGIAADRLPGLFEAYVQAGLEDSRRGTGLGLAICRKIVEAHGGRIWVESAPGQGSRFFFTLPKPS